ncbi:uncharacterized protein LOC107609716 [Arachis ipaensis]|uniref:uncharacterized protein LOC107609716 n=1 Tax=Arachis ipaensis TaxID=130454 RepID=UPI0007AF5D61|nr:uncharacterized protein LOC107609716 [Arachis ipaensis]XP_025628458.1 uncharacterized protein LOC112721626 [Arachis hypogaea]
MKQDYNVQVHPKMIQRALKEAREIVVGNDKAQYGKLWDYLQELHRSNPGSTADMCVDPIPQSLPLFDKIYICLDACRNGFVKGYRPLIGLDGCFLKGYYGGQLLTAMSLDANNHVFVIAYAITRAENTENWMWFLTRLQDDLGDHQVRGWNLMSDQQKGLMRAAKEVMPYAHHRNCVLHIWKNLQQRFNNKQVKGLLWHAAKCTTQVQFKAPMEKFKSECHGGWEYMNQFDPGVWCKAYFSHGPKNDSLTNNMCEVWNSMIVKAREKPILTMCEEIRCTIIKKMAKHKRILGRCIGKLAPMQQWRLDRHIKPQSHKWNAQWSGDNDRVLFEVTRGKHKLGVNLQQHTYTCNAWQLTGMPCVHAVAAISKLRIKAAEDFVSPYLTMDAVRKTYDLCVNPVNSKKFWEKTDHPKPQPPRIVRPAGRPKKRRTESGAPPPPPPVIGDKMKRTFQVTYSKCGEKGHYYKTCKGAPAKPDWQPKRKKAKVASKALVAMTENVAPVLPPIGNVAGIDGGVNNIPVEEPEPINLDPLDTARKNKKKMPKRPHVEPDEINISQTAPTAEVPETDQTTPINQTTTQAPKAQPHSAAPKFRPKQMVRRPPSPPVQSNEHPHNVQA